MKATLRLKIISGFAVVTVAAVALGATATGIMSSANDRFESSSRSSAEQVELVADVHAGAVESLFWGASAASTLEAGGELLDQFVRQLGASANRAVDGMAELGREDLSAESQAHYDKLVRDFSWFLKTNNVFLGTDLPVLDPSVPEPDMSDIPALIDEIGIRQNGMLEAAGALRSQINAEAADARAAAAGDARSSLWTLQVAVGLVSVGMVAFGVWLSGRLVRRLRRTVAVLHRVAEGDLTARFDDSGSDEVGEMGAALNTSLGTVHDVIRQLETDAGKLAALAQRSVAVGAGVGGNGSVDGGSATDELAEMADNLTAMISVFVLEDEGAGAPA